MLLLRKRKFYMWMLHLPKRNVLLIPTVSLTRQLPSYISGKSSTALIPVLCSLGLSAVRFFHSELHQNVVLAVIYLMSSHI